MTNQIEREECCQGLREGEGDRGRPKPNGKKQYSPHCHRQGSETPVDMRSQAELTKDIKPIVLA